MKWSKFGEVRVGQMVKQKHKQVATAQDQNVNHPNLIVVVQMAQVVHDKRIWKLIIMDTIFHGVSAFLCISYRWMSGIWAVFIAIGSGVAGGPGISAPRPIIEIIGFSILAFVNFEGKRKYGIAVIMLILCSLIYEAYYKLQSPYLTWEDVQKRYEIPIGILIFCAFAILIQRTKEEKALSVDEKSKSLPKG